jgi:hypothetical protein
MCESEEVSFASCVADQSCLCDPQHSKTRDSHKRFVIQAEGHNTVLEFMNWLGVDQFSSHFAKLDMPSNLPAMQPVDQALAGVPTSSTGLKRKVYGSR